MAERRKRYDPAGPFRADQVREGDPYEISNGHAIRCLPTGARGSAAAATGAAVLRSDPRVESAGVETGFSPSPGFLRAPDIAVGNVPDAPGWVKGVPPLAVEYADHGQDEADLASKIRELLAAGTRYVWVVRMAGPRRVEVHEPERDVRIATPGEELTAPTVLRNPVPVEALYDWEVGQRITLRNLLQRFGYEDLDAVRHEGREQGLEQGRAEGLTQGLARGMKKGAAEGVKRGELTTLRQSILEVAKARRIESSALRKAIASCRDPRRLRLWLQRAATARSPQELVGEDGVSA